MAGLAIITEACIDVKDRACVDVCPVQCIYEYDPDKNLLFSEAEAGSGVIENTQTPSPDAIAVFAENAAETALAHERIAGIPAERIVNCWPLDRPMAWLSNPLSERRR